jgi:lysophospholipase L1-like esterase
MASDVSAKIRAKDSLGRGLSKEDFTTGLKRAVTPRYGGLKAAFVGDSIMNGSTAQVGRQLMDVIISLIGSSIISVTKSIKRAYPGERSDQILARFPGILAESPDIIFMMIGTNDVYQAKTLAEYSGNIQAMCDLAKAAGVVLVLGTVPPLGITESTSARIILCGQINLWLRLYCQKEKIALADVHSALVNKNAGYALSSYMHTDDIHPKTYGHLFAAREFAKAAAPLVSGLRLVNAVSPFNLCTNPLFITNTSGWALVNETGTAAVYSVVPDTAGNVANPGKLKFGQWLQMDFTATSGGTKNYAYFVNFATAGLAVGDTVLITYQLDYEDMVNATDYFLESVAESPTCKFQFLINRQGFDQPTYITPHASDVPGYASYLFTIPVGFTAMYLAMVATLSTGRHVKFRIGEVGIFKLTGLTGILSMV